MRKVKVIAIAFFLVLLTTGAMAFQNEPDGFRGLKWGDPPTEDMIMFGKDTDRYKRTYTKLEERLFLNNIRLDYIFYDFLITPEKGAQFFSVSLWFLDTYKFYDLEEICRNRFGEPTNKKTYAKDFIMIGWLSETITIFLNNPVLSITQQSLSEEYQNLSLKDDSDW